MPLINSVLNPSAEGGTASLAAESATVVALVADAVTGAGARSYRLAHSSAGLASVVLRAAERPAAASGQRWWARARCRLDTSSIGARKVSGRLTFRDSSGAVIGHRQASIGGDGGATHRWIGSPYTSASERVEGGVSRVNEIVDPQFMSAGQWSRVASMSYDFSYQGEVRIATTAAVGAGTRVIFPAGVVAGAPGESKAARYVVTNTSPTTAISFMANTRAYGPDGGAVNDGLTGAAVTVQPGESMPVLVPAFVLPPGSVGYRPLLSVGALPAGVTFTIAQPIAETAAVAPGVWFDGSLPNTGSSFTDQATIDLVPTGTFYRFTGAANASPSERIQGTTRTLNAAPTVLNGQSATNVQAVRSTLTLLPAENAVRGTITDTAAGALSQRFNIGSPNGASSGAVRVSEGTRLSIQVGFRSTLPSMMIQALFYDSTATIIASATQASPNYPTTANAWNDADFAVTVPAGAVSMLTYFGVGGDATTKTTSDTFDARLLYIGPPGPRFDGNTPNTGTGNTQQVVEFVLTGDAPAGTATADLHIYRDPAYQANAVDVEFVDSVLLSRYEEVTPPPYGDGSTAGWKWTGAANASTSSKPLTAPGLNPLATMDPVPRVEYKFAEVLDGTAQATVFRITGKSVKRVRGAISVAAAGGFSGIDTEAPFNVPLTYRAEMFNAKGVSLGFTDSRNVVVRFDGTVIHQPLDPTRAALVDLRPKFAEEMTRPFQGDVVYPLGSSLGVYIGSGRQGVTGIDLTVVTDSLKQADAFASVWGDQTEERAQLPVVCIRTQPRWRLPMPLFAAVLDPTEARFDTEFGGETIDWPMRGTEVRPPLEALARALLTYADFEATFTTYEAFENAYLTYFDAESDFDLAGTAT